MGYKLDYTIERDIDRLKAVENIIETADSPFRSKDLEVMANYLLYGKDENGKNAMQRGEAAASGTKHNSYKKKSSKEESLDAILENTESVHMTKIGEKYTYKIPKQKIEPEDRELPGMAELQDAIKRIDLSIRYAEGKLNKEDLPEDYTSINSTYQLYQLKHILIDMRRHQYYLKDMFKPTIRFLAADRPSAQHIQWQEAVNVGGLNFIEFNWEDYKHVSALLRNYAAIKMEAWDDPTGWENTLIMDFDRYYNMAQIEPIYDFLVIRRIDGAPYKQIAEEMEKEFNRNYGIAYISCLLSEHIPRRISLAAKRHRLMTEREHPKKECPCCKEEYPDDIVFFKKSGVCYKCYRRYKKWQESELVLDVKK